MYISPLYSNNVPWSTNFDICDSKVCHVRLTSGNKIDFDTLLKFISLTNTNFPSATDITKCITLEPTAKKRFFNQLRLINGKISSLHLPQNNVCTDLQTNQIFRYNFFDYTYSYFVFVTKGDYQNSATRVQVCLFIQNIYPLFSEPYILLPPHPKTPFYEWKTPAKEAFYAEIDCYLLINQHNSNIRNICDSLGPHLIQRIPFLLARSHGARQHFGAYVVALHPELPIKISNNHITRARLRKKNCEKARQQDQDFLSSPEEIIPILSANYQYWERVLAVSYRTEFSV